MRWSAPMAAGALLVLTPLPSAAQPEPSAVETETPDVATADGSEEGDEAGASETGGPAQTPPAEPAPPAASPSAPPSPRSRPPSQYYVEPTDPGRESGRRRHAAPAGPPPESPPPGPVNVYEPPPPGGVPYVIYEPPPPPEPKHRSPRSALWLGARAGWFVPFGDLWGSCFDSVVGSRIVRSCDATAWRDLASAGPVFELDIGARLGRYQTLFFAWERAILGKGGDPARSAAGGQRFGFTDFYAVGLRFSTDPDDIGLLAELDLGWRRFIARWEDGTQLELDGVPLEARIGIGADIRLSSIFSLSPMVTVGGGAFDGVSASGPSATQIPTKTPADSAAGHGWFTVHVGGHFDVFGSK